ncbi:MAG: hypothetical protein AAFO94_04310, partial [Bacteroidota bacterium]
MDLHKAWQELQEENFSTNKIDRDMILQAIHQESGSTMSHLKKHLLGKLMWIIFFAVSIGIWMLMSLSRPELLLILGAFLSYYLVGLLVTGWQYQRLDPVPDLNHNTLQIMKSHHRIISNTIRFEQAFGLFFFPIAVIIGMCTSLHYKGMALSEIFQDANILRIMIIAVIVLTPIGYWTTSLLNKKAFGQHLQQLKENIQQMETV